MYFVGPKSKKCYLWWDNPHLHTKPNLNKCQKVQRSQIFKQNWIILIHSSFIAYLVIWAIPALVEVWMGGSGCGCVYVCPPHAPTFMHMHTCICTCITLKYTCIVIPNGLHGGIHVMFNMHVHMCMHACTCLLAWGTPIHPHPIQPPKRVTPQIS